MGWNTADFTSVGYLTHKQSSFSALVKEFFSRIIFTYTLFATGSARRMSISAYAVAGSINGVCGLGSRFATNRRMETDLKRLVDQEKASKIISL